MRFGVVWSPETSASNYRAMHVAATLEALGHVAGPLPSERGAADAALLAQCDVALVYHRSDKATRAALEEASAAGVALVYDIDDDYTAVPADHPRRDELLGAFERTLAIARLADLMTATTEPVAERYREHGVSEVEVIPNMVGPRGVAPPREHEGLVVGWVAGQEHRDDMERLGLGDVLEDLLDRHRDLRVEGIGVDLDLSDRYHHDRFVPFPELRDRISGFDIGIAPLTDTVLNRARSDIKVKEYAARGVPWLASPVGPYVGLGERQGGRLVDDTSWYDAIDRLLRKRRERRRLSSSGLAWARTQTIASTARIWEAALMRAIDRKNAQSRANV